MNEVFVKKAFPTITQSFLILVVFFMVSIPLSIVNFIVANILGENIAIGVVYSLLILISFYVFNKIRFHFSGENKFYFQKTSLKTLIIVLLTSLTFTIGFNSLVTDLIPISDSLRQELLALGTDNLVLGFIVIVVFAPIFEELIFRGIILDGLLQKYLPAKSILMASFLFSIIHIVPVQIVSAFFAGLFMGWLYFKTRNLLLPIFIHMTNNFLAFILSSIFDSDTKQQSLAETYNGISNYLLCLIASIAIFIGFFYLLRKSLGKEGEFNWEILKHNKQEIL